MFKSKFVKNSVTGIQHEEIDIENKKLLSDYSWFVCNENSSFSIGAHEHNEMEIGYIADGFFELYIENSLYKLKPGDVFIILPGVSHSLKNVTTLATFYNFIWDLNFLESRYMDAGEINYIIPLITGAIKVSEIIRNDIEINSLVKKMIEERKDEKEGYELMTKGLLYQFLGILIRKYCQKNTAIEQLSSSDRDYNLYNSIIIFIETNFDSEITLSDISEKYNISKPAICKLFKKMSGKTFTEYLNYYRIQESLYYLVEDRFTVTQIARSVGFSDQNYFSRVFRRFMHVSPYEYRQRMHHKNY